MRHLKKDWSKLIIRIVCCSVILVISSLAIAVADENTLINKQGFNGIVESYLFAIAINGNSILPTEHPQAAVGDVITFQVTTHNSGSDILYNVNHETIWGSGFTYRGNLTSSQVDCSYNVKTDSILVEIPVMYGKTEDNTYSYTFDLQVVDCSDVSVSIYSDDTYTCQAVKQYYTAIQLENVERNCRDLIQTVHSDNIPVLPDDADLVLFITPQCYSIFSDAPATWAIYVINQGNGAAHDVQLFNILGKNLKYEKSAHPGQPGTGETTVIWNLGDIAEKEMVKIAVTAKPVGDIEDVSGFFNSVYVTWVNNNGVDGANTADDSPCFLLPDRCIYGDVLETKKNYVHGFFSVSRIYKSNLYNMKSDTESMWATYLTPGIWVAVPSSDKRIVDIITNNSTPGGLSVSPFHPATDRRYQSYFQYTPQFEFYDDRHEEDFISHQVDGYVRYDSKNKFSIRAMDQFKRSHDAISSHMYTIDDKYKSNLFNSLATLDLTPKFTLRLDYSNFHVNYNNIENSSLDRDDNSFSGYIYFKFLQKTSLFVEQEFSAINYDNYDLDSHEYRYFGGIRWEATSKSKGQIKGGYGIKTYERPGLSSARNWMTEIQFDHYFSSRTSMVLGAYRRYDEVFYNDVFYNDDEQQSIREGTSKYILTHGLTLSLKHHVTSKIHIDLNGAFYYDEYKPETRQTGRKERHDTEYAVSPSIKFDFLKWMSFDISYAYTNRNSNYPEYDFDDHTIQLRGSISM